MSSKSYQSFDGKTRSLKQHLQLMDLSLTLANKRCSKNKANGKTITETLKSNLASHPQLNIPNQGIDISRTFATSRKKLNEQAIIELYANFSDYLSSVIRENILLYCDSLIIISFGLSNKRLYCPSVILIFAIIIFDKN